MQKQETGGAPREAVTLPEAKATRDMTGTPWSRSGQGRAVSSPRAPAGRVFTAAPRGSTRTPPGPTGGRAAARSTPTARRQLSGGRAGAPGLASRPSPTPSSASCHGAERGQAKGSSSAVCGPPPWPGAAGTETVVGSSCAKSVEFIFYRTSERRKTAVNNR